MPVIRMPDPSAFDELGIVRLDHVSVAVPSVEAALPLFTALVGMTVAGPIDDPASGFRGVELRLPTGQRAGGELLEPASPGSFLARFLEQRGPGVHHVTFEVADTDAAARALRGRGIEPFGGVQVRGDWKETFIHPRDAHGVLIQLYQRVEPQT